jgi:UDP-N-acetyl-D-mannosaminuronate dehydrogenase
MKKDVVIGLGEIGLPIYKILSKHFPVEGVDINPVLNKEKSSLKDHDIDFVHFCIPFSKNFFNIIKKYEKKLNPEAIVIHSTISPKTTEKLQKMIKSPVIYSATRGVHKRMLNDLKRYTKFYSVYNSASNSNRVSKMYERRMKKCGIKTKKLSDPLTLELAKIVVDTSYYGWLINYAQISKIISDKYGVNYDEMWSFSDEIHKFLKNRPKMFPGFIGGHCVIPNLELIDNELLNQIDKINKNFGKKKKKSN